MCYAVHIAVLDNLQHLLYIDASWGEQHFAEWFLGVEFWINGVKVKPCIANHFAHETETVAMYARRRDTHEHIAYSHFATVNELGFLHHTCGVTCDIVFAIAVHTWHLGSLATYEGATCLAATFCHTCYDGLYFLGDVVTNSHVIKEDKWFCALCKHIVHAHSYSIDTNGIVLVHRESEFEFGTYTVGAADEHRLFDVESREVEHSTKRTDIAH